MAPKNSSRLLDNPPSPSPDLEEEEEESSSEEEEQVQTPKKTPTKTHNQQKPKSPSSSEEEEEGSGSGSDDGTKSSPTASDFTIKPVATKNTTKNNLKESTKPSSKRSLELQKDDEKKGPIKKKSKLGAENGEETKRVAVNISSGGIMARVFSEDDEIALLKGMIDYQSQKGSDPGENLIDFLEFVKGNFQFDVTKSQLYEKLRRLKKKFLNNVKKGENGQDPVISRPHEYSCFELSKKIWGKPIANGGDENSKINGGKVKKSGKVKSSEGKMKEDGKKEDEEEEEVGEDDDNMIVEKEVVKDKVVAVLDEDFSSKYRYLSESYDVRDMHMSETLRTFKKENISLIDEEKAKELDEKWKKLRLQEIELFSKRSRLMIEQAKLVMDAMKKR